MYHSITFESESGTLRNTWEHWRLIPTSRPCFAPPKTKTQYISIPGSDNDLDLTESIKGYPVYEDRQGSIEFIVDNDSNTTRSTEWYEYYYQDMLVSLNGKKVKATLEDDPCHYYEGRFFVSGYIPQPHWNKVTLNYIVKPYKMRLISSLEDWLWDPFSFNIGVIQKNVFDKITVDGQRGVDCSLEYLIGRKPICPTFKVSSSEAGIWTSLYNEELGIEVSERFYNGSTVDPRFILSNLSGSNVAAVFFSGNGVVSLDFRSGGL